MIVTLRHIFSILVSTSNAPLGMSGMEDFQANVFMQSSSDDEALGDKGGAPPTHACIYSVFLVQFQTSNVCVTVPSPLLMSRCRCIGLFLHWGHMRLIALDLFSCAADRQCWLVG